MADKCRVCGNNLREETETFPVKKGLTVEFYDEGDGAYTSLFRLSLCSLKCYESLKKKQKRKKTRYAMVVSYLLGMSLCQVLLTSLWYGWWYPKHYEFALRLADDASLPAQKAEYLQHYLNLMETIKGKPRYVFSRPDLDLKKQKEILRGLIVRFQDISKLSPSKMAYQQGMYQLTGQETEHQLDRISGIFQSAKLRENKLFFFMVCWGTWLFPLVGLLIVTLSPWIRKNI